MNKAVPGLDYLSGCNAACGEGKWLVADQSPQECLISFWQLVTASNQIYFYNSIARAPLYFEWLVLTDSNFLFAPTQSNTLIIYQLI